MTPADAGARHQALDTRISCAVAAPAGSGKTGLLTQRVLALLAQVNYPEEILCLTFTRKAAGEMRQRIIAALVEAVDQTQTDRGAASDYVARTRQLAGKALARDRQQGWQLLKSPNRLRIQTIDSFCRNLASQLAPEGGLGDHLEPVDIPTPLYIEAIRECLLTDMERQGPVGEAAEQVLRHLDNDLNKLERLLVSLLQNRDQWLGHLLQTADARHHLEAFLTELTEETLSRASQQLQPVAAELSILADYAATQLTSRDSASPITSCLGAVDLPPVAAEALPRWQGLVELLLTSANQADWRKDGGVNVKLGFPTGKEDAEFGDLRKQQFKALLAWCRNQPELKTTLLDIRFLPPPRYSDTQWRLLKSLLVLLPRIAARLSVVFQDRGRCDFTEIAGSALRALGDDDRPTDLALKLDYQLKHILVDEFQDTSSLQSDLLRRLTRGWSQDDGRSLFIVGDGMQSLYGFRNANVGLFLQARNTGLGEAQLAPLDLTVNFRSQQRIIDWVNRVFQQAFPAQHNVNRGAVRYSDADAFNPPLPGEAVTVDIFADYPDSQTGRQAEAKRVVELAEQAAARDAEGSIAILVRNRSHLQWILAALKDAGHGWQATDIDPLGQQMSVVDLMSLTRALSSVADRIAWLSVLRAPWCGLNLKDLYYLVNPPADELQARPGRYPLILSRLADFHNIAGISAEGKAILARVAPLLEEAWRQRRRKSLRIAVEGLWVALDGNIATENSYNLNSCIDFLNLIDKYEEAGQIGDWHGFNLAVERLYAAPRETSPKQDMGARQIQVMTIHKAKGLEFDTVIMPGLNRQGAADSSDLLLWREGVSATGSPQLFIGPIAETGSERDPLYSHLKRERALKGQLENARVFYVGATRAIRSLHLTFCKDTGKAPSPNSLLNCFWPWLESNPDDGESGMTVTKHSGAVTSESAAAAPIAGDRLQRLPVSWRAVSPFDSTPGKPSAGDMAGGAMADADDPQRRHTGTLLHRILETAVKQNLITGKSGDWNIPQQVPFWRQQLRQLGVRDIAQALEDLTRAVSKLREDRDNHWLFDRQLEQSACELALGYIDESGNIKTSVVDRTFVYQGKRWVVDYKLSEPGDGESLEAFLMAQQSRYRPQLQHYAELFRKQQDHPVVMALYFPLLPRLHILR